MTTRSLAEPRHPDTRESRALELFRARGRELERIAPDVYLVPSCTGEATYRVDLADESCDCKDFEIRRENCKHILAAAVKRAKRRGTTARRLAALEDHARHEDLGPDERGELLDRLARARRLAGL